MDHFESTIARVRRAEGRSQRDSNILDSSEAPGWSQLSLSWIGLQTTNSPGTAEGQKLTAAKWEYKVELLRTPKAKGDDEVAIIQDQLNELSAQGWELLQFQQRVMILKRAK